MDEVQAMARAGETMGKAMGTGMRAARCGATHAGQKGADASKRVAQQAATRAETELANRGVVTDDLQEKLAQKGKRARKKLDKRTRRSRKEFAKNTRRARKELAQHIDPSSKHKRRRWPWALLLLVGAVVVAGAVLSRRPEEFPLDSPDELDPQGSQRHNGQTPPGSSATQSASTLGKPPQN